MEDAHVLGCSVAALPSGGAADDASGSAAGANGVAEHEGWSVSVSNASDGALGVEVVLLRGRLGVVCGAQPCLLAEWSNRSNAFSMASSCSLTN